ncbi:MAG: hypothetical protein WA823_16605 [Candidatus Acidiferrales bacterium]
MKTTLVVKIAALLEIVVGAALIAAPNFVSGLLFGSALDGAGVVLGRFAGIALFSLGIGGISGDSAGARNPVALSLLIFNAGAAIFLVWVGVATPFRGVLLWPAAILHAALTCGLLWTRLRTAPR